MRFNLRLIFMALLILLFVVALAGGLLWANLDFVHKVPGGADFLVLWKSGQDFLVRGNVPYQDLTRQLQDFVYGHAARQGETLPRLSLPLYLLLIFSPFAMIQDPWLARAVWMVFLEIELLGLVLLVIQLTHWKPGRLYLIILMLFGVFWAPAVASLLSGNTIIFQAVLIFGAMRAIEFGSDELAGALLALAWFNFEVVGLPIILVLLWVWTVHRLRVWGGFLMTTIVLAGISIFFNANWLLPFLGALLANWRLNSINPSTFSLFEGWLPAVGIRLAQGLTLAVALMLIAEWRAVRGKDLRWLLWTASLTVAATPLLGLPFAPTWLVLSLPVLLLVLSIMEQRWGVFGRWSAVALFTIVFFGLWAAFRYSLGSVFVLFFPVTLIFLLYWVRWWAIRPPRLWADIISDMGK